MISKKLTAKKREELYDVILEGAVFCWNRNGKSGRIDEINILQATYEAMRQAISKLSVQPQLFLNDAVTIPEVRSLRYPLSRAMQKAYPLQRQVLWQR